MDAGDPLLGCGLVMASWVPPIPGGKLTSKPVRQLGSAVTFLHWCYEAVRRDGTIEFQIGEVADYLDESYYTVRKWWSLVKDGPWFCEVIDRGKRGFSVHMHDDWLEWRTVKSSSSVGQVPNLVLDDDQEKPAERSSAGEMHDLVLEETDNADEMPVKLRSNENEVPEMVLDDRMYKVLHTDQKKHARSSRKRSDVRSSGEEIDEPLSVETTPQAIRRALYDTCQIAETASRGVKLNANSAAKRFWQAGSRQGKSEQEIADAIRYVGSWCRKNPACWQCKDGSAPTPKLIGDYWRQAIESRDKSRAPPGMNGTNGAHAPTEPTLTREQLKATFAGQTYVRTPEQS